MKIRMYKIEGHWYHGIEINGRLFLIGYIGRVGDCIRP